MDPVRRLDAQGLAIFLFHGVVEGCDCTVRNYTRKHLLKNEFARLIKSLARTGAPTSMENVIRHIGDREPFPPRSFAVTFDDGFENNLLVAAPILADCGVPATFYVTTDFVERNTMSWIDRIELCFELASPGRVRLPWAKEPCRFRSAQDRIRILNDIRAHVKTDCTINREAMIGDLFNQCRVAEIRSGDGPLDRKLTWGQVRELNANPLFTIGGHSHTHATLSQLTRDDLYAEVATSIHLLRARAGIEPRHYSYPEGLDYCYSPQVISLLRTFGVRCCPTAIDGLNDERTDLFHLKRIMVNDVDDLRGRAPVWTGVLSEVAG
jgi:peptidoglycan/xylan/chitin deacetylase (PgdA/CDA1 family)